MDLSIVIPALNESQKIDKDIDAANRFLSAEKLEGEIIVVDDGSSDDTTHVAEACAVDSGVTLNVLRCGEHHGKGYAVRAGMATTSGQYVMFADSGLCVPFHFAGVGLDMLRNGMCDIAHGSRKLPESVIVRPQPLSRRWVSRFFRWFIILFMHVPRILSDTQCGFKLYKGDVARRLYQACITDGFTFDVEIILRARQSRLVIHEFPIEWTADPDSRLSQTLRVAGIWAELLRIKKALK